MDESTLSSTPPARLRLQHAEYFLAQYRLHSGPPRDAYWLMAAYFDAFLFALVTVWDMSDKGVQEELNRIMAFQFVRTLRNISTHHSILAVGVAGNKFQRPFAREMNASMGGPPDDSSRLFFRLDVLRQILEEVKAELEAKKRKFHTDDAYAYIAELEARGGYVYLEDIMAESIRAVDAVLPQA